MHSVVHLFLYFCNFSFASGGFFFQLSGVFICPESMQWILILFLVNRRKNQPGLEHLLLVRKMKRDIT